MWYLTPLPSTPFMGIYLLYRAGSAKVKYVPGYDVKKIWHQTNHFPVFHTQIYIHDTYMKNNTNSDRRNMCDKTQPAYNTNCNLYNITSQQFFKIFYTWCSLADCRPSDWIKLYLIVFSVFIVHNIWRGYVLELPCCLSTFSAICCPWCSYSRRRSSTAMCVLI